MRKKDEEERGRRKRRKRGWNWKRKGKDGGIKRRNGLIEEYDIHV